VPDHLLERLQLGLSKAADGDPRLLSLAAVAFVAALLCDGAAWRAGFAVQARRLTLHDTTARYATGSLVNALVPARVGTVTRLGLFARAAGGRATVATGAAIGGAHVIILAGLATIGLGPSMLPVPLYVIAPVVGATVVVAIAARRKLGTAQVAPWIVLATVLRLAAATVVASAFGVGSPVAAGCAMLAALGLSGTLPITPGNAGVGAAAVAFALAGRGVPGSAGLAAGVAFGLVETAVAIACGLVGLAVLVLGRRRQRKATWAAQPVPVRAT
jgi:uncharacterized membrane protein YbhN (UPF0104 family)